MSRGGFVYELRYSVRTELCWLLDVDYKWKELGGEDMMGFDNTHLQHIQGERSPTDKLLSLWGNQNHTVNELFFLLSRMQFYTAMTLLKDLVDTQYHYLLKEDKELMIQPKNKNLPEPENHKGTNQKSDQQPSPNVSAEGFHHALKDKRDRGLNHDIINKVNKKATNNTIHAVPMQNEPKVEIKQQENKNYNKKIKDCTPNFDYKRLSAATNGWSNVLILGEGGYGTVYKGMLEKTYYAIKKLKPKKDQIVEMSKAWEEVRLHNFHRHDNILSLYGYSMTENNFCLVYQYMSNGSLKDRLWCKGDTTPLTWFQRLKILSGTARGIQFLHSRTPPLVHGDIKSANILLDSNFEPHIGDLGLARNGPDSPPFVELKKPHGTLPYLAEEFSEHPHVFSVKIDTYSFGVVLFEVATGLRVFDERRTPPKLKDYIMSLRDDELSSKADKKTGVENHWLAANLLMVGRDCVARIENRPNMTRVFLDVHKLYYQEFVVWTKCNETTKRVQQFIQQEVHHILSTSYVQHNMQRNISSSPSVNQSPGQAAFHHPLQA